MVETGPLIDGALPRDPHERCAVLFTHAESLHKDFDPLDLEQHALLGVKLDQMRTELRTRAIDDEFWNEVEDDLIELINDLLPDQYICTLGEPNPGDVIIVEREED